MYSSLAHGFILLLSLWATCGWRGETGSEGWKGDWDLHACERTHTHTPTRTQAHYSLQSTFAVTIATTLLAHLQAVNRLWLPTIKKSGGTKVPVMTESFWQAVKVASQRCCHRSIWGKCRHSNCDGWLALWWLWLTYCMIPHFPDLAREKWVLDPQKRLTAPRGFVINSDPDFGPPVLCFAVKKTKMHENVCM